MLKEVDDRAIPLKFYKIALKPEKIQQVDLFDSIVIDVLPL